MAGVPPWLGPRALAAALGGGLAPHARCGTWRGLAQQALAATSATLSSSSSATSSSSSAPSNALTPTALAAAAAAAAPASSSTHAGSACSSNTSMQGRSAAAAAGAALVAALGLGCSTALADARPPSIHDHSSPSSSSSSNKNSAGSSGTPASPLDTAKAAVTAAWHEACEDLGRANAALPAHAAPLRGTAPLVSATPGGLEVVVPVRGGADTNAVLDAMVQGFTGRATSMQTRSSGAGRTVTVRVEPGLCAQLVVAHGGDARVTVTKEERGGEGFTPQELRALGALVRAANAPPGAPAGSAHAWGGGGGAAVMDDLQRELGGALGGLLAGGMHGIMQELLSELGAMRSGMEQQQQQGWGEGGDDEEGGAPHALEGPRSSRGYYRPGGGGAGAPGGQGGAGEWGSARAAQAAQQLQAMGVTVTPPGPKKGTMDWEGLAGYEPQKRLIEDCLLLPLLHPEVFSKITEATRAAPASNRPRAVLFEGPPGTGKTTSARVISAQASVPLVYVPLEAVLSKWYGESEGLLAKVFRAAEALGGAIIFLDELDALGGNRSRGEIHEASRRLLSILLKEMDGFVAAGNNKAIVIGATNRKMDLDPALLSRFDLSITFDAPDEATRALILAQYARQLSASDLAQLAAAAAPAMSGRDLRDVCEQTERRWASKIIRGEAKPGSTPPLAEYLASAAQRAATTRQAAAAAAQGPTLLRYL